MRRKRNRQNNNALLFAILLSIIVFSVISFFFINKSFNRAKPKTDSKENITLPKEDNIKKPEKPVVKDYKLTSVGNIILHGKQITGARQADGSYNFDNSFKYIKNYTSNSDISIGVVEGSFAGGKPSGYPYFNMPDDFLKSLKNSGINVVNMASNHVIDHGTKGILRGIQKIEENNLTPLGIKPLESSKNYSVFNLGSHKVGLFSFTYKTDVNAINGIPIPYDSKKLINTFNYSNKEEFKSNVNNIINNMKNEGVDFIIGSMHWGEEYHTTQNKSQESFAKILNEAGTDIILGNHPHVVQPYQTLKSSTGHETFVTYGQGNFLSNQCTEELGKPLTEDGFLIEFTLSENEDKKLFLKNYTIVPTWVHRKLKPDGSSFDHVIIPVKDAIKNPSKFNLSNSDIQRVNRSLNDTNSILGLN